MSSVSECIICDVLPGATASFRVVQEWECCVQDISDDNTVFNAQLIDITRNRQYPDEEADFGIENVDEADRHLIKIGGIFKWMIGYEYPFVGKKKLTSKIHFVRMPVFTEQDIIRAEKKAEQFMNEIRWE